MLTEPEYNSDTNEIKMSDDSSDEDVRKALNALNELRQKVDLGFESYFEEKRQLLLQQQNTRHRRKRKYQQCQFTNVFIEKRQTKDRKVNKASKKDGWLQSQIKQYTDYSSFVPKNNSQIVNMGQIKANNNNDYNLLITNDKNQNCNQSSLSKQKKDENNVDLYPVTTPHSMKNEIDDGDEDVNLTAAFGLGLPVLNMFDSDNAN